MNELVVIVEGETERRITSTVPAYKKRAQGPIVTGRIGIDVLRTRCTHFGEWLTRLEQLGITP